MALQDLRGQGPPGDIGSFQSPCSVIVYSHIFSGTTYYVAARQGDRGWVLIDHGTTFATVIQAALNLPTTIHIVVMNDATVGAGIHYMFDHQRISGLGAHGPPTLTLANGVNDHMFDFGNTHYCRLEDLRLEGNSANNVTSSGIFANVGYDHEIKSVSSMRFARYGLEISSAQTGLTVRDSYFEYNVLSGAYIRAYQVFLDQCDFFGNIQHGCELVGYIADPIADGQRGLNATLSRCRFEGNTLSGIHLAEDVYNHPIQEAQIVNSTVVANKQHGILMEGARKCIIANNTIRDNSQQTNNTYDGIHLKASAGFNCLKNIISDNQIYSSAWAKTQRYGIRENDANQTQNTVYNNTILGNSTGQVSLQGAGSRAEGNLGYNPVGNIANPYPVAAGILADVAAAQAFPTTATNYTVAHSPKLITIYGGTITSVSIDGVATGQAGAATFAAYFLKPGQILNVVWTVQLSSSVYAC